MDNPTLLHTSATDLKKMSEKNTTAIWVDTEGVKVTHDFLPRVHGFHLGYAVGVLTRGDHEMRLIASEAQASDLPAEATQAGHTSVVVAAKLADLVNSVTSEELDDHILCDDQASTAAVYKLTVIAERMDLRAVDSAVDHTLAQQAKSKLSDEELKALLRLYADQRVPRP